MTTQAPVNYAIGRYTGLPGSITRYFWVQAIYPSGRSVVSNLVTVSNASLITNGNQINIQWAVAPGAIGYDVIETPTSSAPSLNVLATIAVAQGLTDTNFTLTQEPVLQPWTYETGNATIGSDITIGTTQILSGADGSILYQAAGLVAESADLTWDATTGIAIGKAVAIVGDVTVTGKVTASSDVATSGLIKIASGGSTTISTGVGSVKMTTGNAATNTAWIPISYAGTTYYVPAWTTNAP